MPLVVSLIILAAPPCPAVDPQSTEVRETINRAKAYLRDNVDAVKPYEAGIVAYALMRSGESAESPAVKTLLRRVLADKFDASQYARGTPHQFYEAGTDMMMLEAADPSRYGRQIEIIATFTVDHQWPSGSWYYLGQPEHGGDTSHTQYAVLGLWAASRAGLKVSTDVWDRVADWHLKNQLSDGGFAYHPGEVKVSTHTMTVNGVASLCVARMMLYPDRQYPSPFDSVKGGDDQLNEPGDKVTRPGARGEAKDEEPAAAPPSVLVPLDLSGNRHAGRPRRGRVVGSARLTRLVSLSALNGGIARGADWIRANFTKGIGNQYEIYYLYGLERMCALAGIQEFSGHDWYSEHAVGLISKQRSDGHFVSGCGFNVDTAFAILFLSRATSRLMGRPEERFGGGLMVGGRGLPSNLAAIRNSSDGIQVRKVSAPVDKLLSELENPKNVEVESVQQAIVETVQIGDREKLVGQKARLKKLARDRRPEVRRTAMWALGRCATVRDALVLVKGLDDPDINVVIEANNALCWLSRRPNGFGRPSDPVADLPENASDHQRRDAAEAWRTQIRKDWREWFHQVGPYSERDLPIDLPGTEPP